MINITIDPLIGFYIAGGIALLVMVLLAFPTLMANSRRKR